jgi:hypothetical protein
VESNKWNHWLRKHYSTKKSEFSCVCGSRFVEAFDYAGDCPRCEQYKKDGIWDFQSALGDTIKEKYESLYVKVVELSNVINRKTINQDNWLVFVDKVDPFYEMIGSWIKGKRRCKECYRRLWLEYSDGHVADVCFHCVPKIDLTPAAYVTSYGVPEGPVPTDIEVRDFQDQSWRKSHERYYRLKANLEDLKLDVLWQNPYILGVDGLRTNCSSLTNE